MILVLTGILVGILGLAAVEIGCRLAGVGHPASLLIPLPGGDGQERVENPDVTRPFFGRGLVRTPKPIRIVRPKPPETYRVMVLGGSAAMGDPLPAFGLARHLQCRLEARYPGRRVEVINAAMTAINSHVVRPLAEELARHEPDVAVIYLGNNEVIGPFGPATAFQEATRFRWWIRASIALRRSRLGQALSAGLGGNPPRDRPWGGMEMFLDTALGPDDPRVLRSHRQFAANLEDIVEAFRRRGVPVVVSTVAVNLDAFAPLFPPEQATSYQVAQQAEQAGDRRAAWDHYRTARDEDRFRFRADTGINAAIRDVVGGTDDPGIRLVDATARFRDRYLAGGCGEDWFVDHVHFTFVGNALLAADLLHAWPHPVEADTSLSPPARDCRGRLGYSPWMEVELHAQMQNRRRQPPFPLQADHLDRMIALDQALEEARNALSPGLRQAWIDALASWRIRRPDDPDLHLQAGRLLMGDRSFSAAWDAFRAAVRLQPHRVTPASYAAVAHTLIEGADAAREALTRAWRGPQNRLADVHHHVAAQLMDNDEEAAAEQWVDAGLRLDPTHPDLLYQAALLAYRQGDLDNARKRLQDLRPVHPLPGRIDSLLGVIHGDEGNWEQAAETLDRAVDLLPADPVVLYRAGMANLRCERLVRARHHLSRLLDAAPADRDAARAFLGIVWKQGDLTAWHDRVELLLRLDPDEPVWLGLRALGFAREGRQAEVAAVIPDESEGRDPRLALAAWLVATASDPSGLDPAVLTAFEIRFGLRSREMNDDRALIGPAVAARLGRFGEAEQRALALGSLGIELSAAGRELLAALRASINRGEPLCLSIDDRMQDPVLVALGTARLESGSEALK